MATIIHYSNLESPRSIFDFHTHSGYDDHHHRSIRVGSPFDDYYYVRPTASRRHRRRVAVPVMRRMINRSFLDPWASFENSCNNDLQLEHRLSFDHDSESLDPQPELPSDSQSLAFDNRLLKLFTGLSSERHPSLYHDRPRIQKHEDEKQWTVDIELPGVKPNDVDVAIEKDHVLHITGKRQKHFPRHDDHSDRLSADSSHTEAGPPSQPQEALVPDTQAASGTNTNVHTTSTFKYSYTLPGGIDEDRIQASLENGVLRVSVPKVDVSANRHRRKIAINTTTGTGNTSPSRPLTTTTTTVSASTASGSGTGSSTSSSSTNKSTTVTNHTGSTTPNRTTDADSED